MLSRCCNWRKFKVKSTEPARLISSQHQPWSLLVPSSPLVHSQLVAASFFPRAFSTVKMTSSRKRISPQLLADRSAGAIVGSIIGDALAATCRWYYDINEMQRKYGMVNGYVEPSKGHYHDVLKAGDYTLSAEQCVILMRSLIESKGNHYHQQDFCRRMDQLFETFTLEDLPYTGRDGYVDGQTRDVCKSRRIKKLDWSSDLLASSNDTTEGSQRAVALVARYSSDDTLQIVTQHAWQNIALTYHCPVIIAYQVSFSFLLVRLIQGASFTSQSLYPQVARQMRTLPGMFDTDKEKGIELVKNLPFADDKTLRSKCERAVNNPDAALLAFTVMGSLESGLLTLPAGQHHRCSQIYGQSCSSPYVMGGAYYLAHVFRNNFEAGVLAAVNGGGQNVSRASHVGALIGAQVGLSGIPSRFITGLKDSEQIVSMAKQLAAVAAAEWAEKP